MTSQDGSAAITFLCRGQSLSFRQDMTDHPVRQPNRQLRRALHRHRRRPFFARQLLYETLDQMHRLDREDLGVLGRLLVLPGLRVLWLQVVLRLLAALEVRLDPVDLVDQSKMQARGSAWLPQNTWLSLARLLHSASIIAEVCRERQCSRVLRHAGRGFRHPRGRRFVGLCACGSASANGGPRTVVAGGPARASCHQRPRRPCSCWRSQRL